MKYFLLLPTLVFSIFLSAQSFTAEQKQIAELIQTSYAEGLQNEGNFEKIDAGFHPDFEMISKGDADTLKRLSLSKWKQYKKQSLEAGRLPRKTKEAVSLEFIFVDISGDVAVAKINYLEGGAVTYIDYISLYKYAEGWKIIAKIFQKL